MVYMTHEEWKISNERSHYECLKRQHLEYHKTIEKLLREIKELKNKLKNGKND